MSKVAISYSSLSNAAWEAKDVAKKLDKYADTINSDVYKKLSKYDGKWTSNISAASSAASRKISSLRTEEQKYRDYATDLTDLKDECKRVDKGVAQKVSKLTASFKKAHGISNNVVINKISNFFTTLGNLTAVDRWLDTQSDVIDRELDYLKESIEDWYDYEGGKEFLKGVGIGLLEIAIAIAGIVVVALGTVSGVWAVIAAVAAVVGGVIAVVDGITNIVNEGRALGYASDDPATAKRKSDLNTLSDTMRAESDSEFWHGIAKALDTASFVCGVIGIVDGCGKLLKNVLKWGTGNLTSLKDLRLKDILTKDNIKTTFTKLKVTLSQGWGDFTKALAKKDWAFFGDVLADFKTDFLANLKKGFTFKPDNLKGNIKAASSYMKLAKGFLEDGFSISNIMEGVVIPCVNVAGVTSIEFPEGGGQGEFQFDSIKLKDILDLKKIKTGIIDKGLDVFNFNDGFADADVLKKLNEPVEINISIPDIYIPEINIPVVRAA